MLVGRVVREELGGLPGAAIEGAWVTLHSVERGRPPHFDALPPAIAQAQTGPQGDFVLAPSATLEGHELLLAVWLDLDQTPLALRPVEGVGAELVLTVRMNGAPAP